MTYAETLQASIHSSLAILLLQLLFILVVCRFTRKLLSYLRQPPVCGEILAGILMGPTVMGQSKAFTAFLFPASGSVLLKGISDLGIIFFMFILGLEFDPTAILGGLKKCWIIAVAGIALPFGLGAAISEFLFFATGTNTESPPVRPTAFLLFTSASMSFTAFPVLARILTANNAMTAQIGLVSMGIASVDDLLAWTVLAIATSYNAGGDPEEGAWGILIGIAWVVFLLLVVRRILLGIQSNVNVNTFVVLIFLGMCASAWITQVLGLHAFFGGFVFGICVPKQDRGFIEKFVEQLEILVVNFFVPLFFANTGLRTDLTKLDGKAGPLFLVLFCATAGKMVPAFFLGKCRGYSWRFSFQLATLLNSRGLMELIALEVAQTSGVFNTQMFSMFVIMALVTTFMAGPLFYWSYRPDLDPPLVSRGEGGVAKLAEPKALNIPDTVPEKSEQDQPDAAEQDPSTELQPLARNNSDVKPLPNVPLPNVVPPVTPSHSRLSSYPSACREVPEQAQIEPTPHHYSYLFHGTVYHKKEEPSIVRKASITDLFNLPTVRRAQSTANSFSVAEGKSPPVTVRGKSANLQFESLRTPTFGRVTESARASDVDGVEGSGTRHGKLRPPSSSPNETISSPAGSPCASSSSSGPVVLHSPRDGVRSPGSLSEDAPSSAAASPCASSSGGSSPVPSPCASSSGGASSPIASSPCSSSTPVPSSPCASSSSSGETASSSIPVASPSPRASAPSSEGSSVAAPAQAPPSPHPAAAASSPAPQENSSSSAAGSQTESGGGSAGPSTIVQINE